MADSRQRASAGCVIGSNALNGYDYKNKVQKSFRVVELGAGITLKNSFVLLCAGGQKFKRHFGRSSSIFFMLR